MRVALATVAMCIIAGVAQSAQAVLQPSVPWISYSENTLNGTGVVVSSHLVLTAKHVVSRGDSVFVAKWPATVVCRDAVDLAVIQAESYISTRRVPPISAIPVSFRMPSPGEVITVAGYPDGTWSVLRGYIRDIQRAHVVGLAPLEMLELSTLTHYGSSGSPVIDGDGTVIGIVTGGMGGSYASFGVAVPLAKMGSCRQHFQ